MSTDLYIWVQQFQNEVEQWKIQERVTKARSAFAILKRISNPNFIRRKKVGLYRTLGIQYRIKRREHRSAGYD